MKNIKLLTVVGARPQFVKAAVVSRSINDFNINNKEVNISEDILHTGQHYDHNMSDVFFEEMEIPQPKYNLGIGGRNHGEMTGRQIIEIEKILLKNKYDAVLVYGDTNSTLSATIAACKLNIDIIHVEAGLRSFNMSMPEEVNRVLTDRVSRLLLCPTDISVANLKNEGFENSTNSEIKLVGDVMLDAALYYRAKKLQPTGVEIDNKRSFALATIHREENTGDIQLSHIVDQFNLIATQIDIVLPVHPRIKDRLATIDKPINFKIIEPVSYFEMLWLLDKCSLVITDSGGLQKEAYFFNKYCITLRNETEWVELIDNKVNFLHPVTSKNLNEKVEQIIQMPNDRFKHTSLYGNGDAGKKIIEIIAGLYK
ncbi:non-hydrolyzing UDP-N-acetylglucosamine 2-epimerase [Vibrio breoganii]